MKQDITKFPPLWAKDAIAGPYGWHHPVTHELLVSVRGIQVPVGTNPYTTMIIDEDPRSFDVIMESPLEMGVIDETVAGDEVLDESEPEQEVIHEEAATQPKRRGRPRKNAE